MKQYQALRIGKEVQTLLERAQVLLYAALAILLQSKWIVSLTLQFKLKLHSEEVWRRHVVLGPLSFWTFIIVW